MKTLLEGKPLHHPLHPLLVHFPIGLFFFSFALDIARLILGSAPALVVGAFYSMAFGIIGALIAALPGLADYSEIRSSHPAKRTATLHMLRNCAKAKPCARISTEPSSRSRKLMASSTLFRNFAHIVTARSPKARSTGLKSNARGTALVLTFARARSPKARRKWI